MDSLYAVAVLIISPEGTPLVRDPKKPMPRYWKLPGGRSEGKETPEECAVREIWQETGLEIDQDNLRVIGREDRGDHTLIFFRVDVPALKNLKQQGDELEEVKVFPSLTGIGKMENFFPNHRGVVQKVAISIISV